MLADVMYLITGPQPQPDAVFGMAETHQGGRAHGFRLQIAYPSVLLPVVNHR
jgi:hypothetical protein